MKTVDRTDIHTTASVGPRNSAPPPTILADWADSDAWRNESADKIYRTSMYKSVRLGTDGMKNLLSVCESSFRL